MSLPELTDHLISDPQAAEKLRLADSYILQMQRVGRNFVLPSEHAVLEPIIQRYAQNFPRFVSYVKDLRNTVEPRSGSYIALHELYRMLEVRLVQQQRRDRARKALDWLRRKHPKLTVEQQGRWIRKLEQQWTKERMEFLENHRRKTATGRLSTDEREELLEKFWKEVDVGVEAGDLPSP